MKNGAFINEDGAEIWYRNGVIHREDGPAVMWPDGEKNWYHNGVLHRSDGPAVITAGGNVKWYTHGTRHTVVRTYSLAAKWTEQQTLNYILKYDQYLLTKITDYISNGYDPMKSIHE